MLICQECKSAGVETESDIVCPKCGFVLSKRYVDSMQYFTPDELEQMNYTEHIDPNTFVNPLATNIDFYNSFHLRDFRKKNIYGDKMYTFKRLKKINDIYEQNAQQSHLYRILRDLNLICGVLLIPRSIKSEAAKICKIALHDIGKRFPPHIIASASLYLVVKQRKFSLSIHDFQKTLQSLEKNANAKKIVKAALYLRKSYRIDFNTKKPEEYILTYIEKLFNNPELLQLIEKTIKDTQCYKNWLKKLSYSIIRSASKNKGSRLNGTLAAAAIVGADYLLASRAVVVKDCYQRKKKRGLLNQRLIAKTLGIKEYTLREHYLLIIKPILPTVTAHVKQETAKPLSHHNQ